jgi:tetratricopeptide (TPR) repeat protein
MSIRWSLRRLRRRYGGRLRTAFAAAVATLVTLLSTVFDRIPTGLQAAALLLIALFSAAAVLLLEPPVAGQERAEGRGRAGRRRAEKAAGPGPRERTWSRWLAAALRRLRNSKPVPALPPRDDLFSGRLAELAILTDAHDEARAGRTAGRRWWSRGPVRARHGADRIGPVVLLVHGMPGVGKTALADELARTLASRYPDGQLFVNMGTAGAARTPNEVLKELLLALGWSEEEMPDTAVDRALVLRSLTAKKRILFILDAARHSDQIRHVLPSDPANGVIVTSRRDLFLSDPLPALSYSLEVPDEDDALSIFRSVSHTHEGVRPECAAEIVDLCGRLPLAIRSAAERVYVDGTDVCHVADLLRSSRSRLDWLDQPGRPLRAHLDTEYDRLLPLERRAFAMLSLVPSATFVPWVLRPLMGLPAAEAEALVDRLTAAKFLGDAGPDDASGVARYSFHPLVKLYADEQAGRLSADERAAAQHDLDLAYREVALGVLRDLHPDLRERWTLLRQRWEPRWIRDDSTLPRRIAQYPETWVRNEYPSLLRVMTLCRGNGGGIDGGVDGGVGDERLDTILCWRIGVWLGGCVSPGVSPESALDAYAQALRAAEEDGGGLGTVDVLLAKGTFLIAIERYRAAEECLTQAAELAAQLIKANGADPAGADPDGSGHPDDTDRPARTDPSREARLRIAGANRKLGEAFLQAACYRPAVEFLEKALILAEADQDESEWKLDRILIADAYRVDAPEATFDQLQNSELPDATRYRVFLSLTEAARRRQEWRIANDYLSQALRFVDGDLRRVATVQYRMARLLLDEYADLRGEALAAAAAAGGLVGDGSPAVPAEAVQVAIRAVRRCAAAAVTFRKMDNPVGLVRAHTLLIRAMLAIGRPVEAEHLTRIAESEHLALGGSGERTEILLPIAARLKRADGELRLAAGDAYGARELLMEAATALGENQDWAVVNRVLTTLGRPDDRDHRAAGAGGPGPVRQGSWAGGGPLGSPLPLSRAATEGLAARLGSIVADRMHAEIRDALVPAAPVAFQGGIRASLSGAVRQDAGGPPVWRVPVAGACELTVLVTTGRQAFAEAGNGRAGDAPAVVTLPFAVTTGLSAPHVDITVDVDAPLVEVSGSPLFTSCRTEGDTVRYRTSVLVDAPGRYDLRIELFSSRRLVQALPIELVAGTREGTEASAAGSGQ